MDGYYIAIIALIGLPALWGIATWMEAYSFKQKLYGLGHLVGRTKEDIIQTVGAPNSFSAVADGRELLQWQRPGYHIALIFRDGLCEGVTHEYAAR